VSNLKSQIAKMVPKFIATIARLTLEKPFARAIQIRGTAINKRVGNLSIPVHECQIQCDRYANYLSKRMKRWPAEKNAWP